MNVLTLQSTYGGLLHDTGKAVYRAGGQRGSHSEQGYQFLHGVLPGADWAPALDCVRYHHAAALRGAARALPADSPAYIIYLADDLSAAADRREVEGESSSFRRDLPLDSVFTHLNGTHPGWMMPAQPQDGNLKLPRQQQPLSASVYADAVRKLKECLPDLQPQPEWINSLMGLLETQFSCFPSSTFTGESPDVSLFDHAKTTAAIAACISEYVQANNITDLRKALFEQEKDFCQKDAFLLYTADFSRIQKFLYTVHTENALRSLRSRSFFLELLMEHYLDELLAGCGVSRANLIYSGGGHCYVLLPNTAAVADTLTRWNRQFNRWLLQQFGTQLFLANAWTPCSGSDLTNTPAEKSPYKELFRRVNRLLEQHKFHRYTAEDLRQLNSTAAYPDGRECKVCGTSANLKDNLCPWCRLFVDLSYKIQNKTAFESVVCSVAAFLQKTKKACHSCWRKKKRSRSCLQPPFHWNKQCFVQRQNRQTVRSIWQQMEVFPSKLRFPCKECSIQQHNKPDSLKLRSMKTANVPEIATVHCGSIMVQSANPSGRLPNAATRKFLRLPQKMTCPAIP